MLTFFGRELEPVLLVTGEPTPNEVSVVHLGPSATVKVWKSDAIRSLTHRAALTLECKSQVVSISSGSSSFQGALDELVKVIEEVHADLGAVLKKRPPAPKGVAC